MCLLSLVLLGFCFIKEVVKYKGLFLLEHESVSIGDSGIKTCAVGLLVMSQSSLKHRWLTGTQHHARTVVDQIHRFNLQQTSTSESKNDTISSIALN